MRLMIMAALAALQIGCVMKVVRDDSQATGEKKTYQLKSLLWAFVPIAKLPPASEMCPGAQVQTLDLGMEPHQVLLTWVTAGIFVPHRAEVTCSRAAAIQKN
jgi:hypothetical protein